MLPRVTFEYGQTTCALSISACAASRAMSGREIFSSTSMPKPFGIGSFAARTAQFLRRVQLEVEIACGNDSTAIAATCGVGMGAVEDFFE